MTRQQLKAWAQKIEKFDHLTYVGKDITVADVKLATGLALERQPITKEALVEAIESAIIKCAASHDLSTIDASALIEYAQHAAGNAVQSILLIMHDRRTNDDAG